MTTWLVTGATGFLGSNAAHFLADRARRVGGTRTGVRPRFFDDAVVLDLMHPGSLAAPVAHTQPDVILHCAAMASHELCEQEPGLATMVNAEAAGALARAAEDVGAQFVLISTDAVFDGARGHYREEDQPAPTSVYGRTKLQGEERVTAETAALIIRTNFFGWSPTGRRSILEFFVNELSAGHAVRGFTDFTTSSAYVVTLLDAIAALVEKRETGTFHVTSPQALTKYDFGVAVAREFGLDESLIAPTRADVHPPRNGDISLDVSKVEGALGRSLPSQLEGIHRARLDAETLRGALLSPSGS